MGVMGVVGGLGKWGMMGKGRVAITRPFRGILFLRIGILGLA